MTGDPSPRVLFAGGGTGGHIHPNLAILERLAALAPATRAHFIVSGREIDARVLAHETVPWTAIPAAPVSVRPRGLLRFIRRWGPSLRAVRALIREFRPHALVTTGGFVSAPVARAARVARVPIILIALDDPPGKASRLIARHADHRLLASFTPPGAGWERIPPIVRLRATADRSAPECRRRLGLDPDRPTLFVTGGSQGARSMNQTLAQAAPHLPNALAGWQVFHQCGADAGAALEAAYAGAGIPHRVVEYCESMGDAWGAADLAIARAGAGTVGEVARNAVPTVFLPYPHHRDQHQKRNAAPLVHAGGAVLLEDTADPTADAPRIVRTLAELAADDGVRARMRASLRQLASGDGAETVARLVLSLDSVRRESEV